MFAVAVSWFYLCKYDFTLVVLKPSMQNLTLIKWRDNQKKEKMTRIIRRISDKHRDIGLLLGQSMQDIENDLHKSNNNTIECCQSIFSRWIENDGCQSYPHSWEGLCELLYNIEKCGVEDELMEALGSHGIFAHRLSYIWFCCIILILNS